MGRIPPRSGAMGGPSLRQLGRPSPFQHRTAAPTGRTSSAAVAVIGSRGDEETTGREPRGGAEALLDEGAEGTGRAVGQLPRGEVLAPAAAPPHQHRHALNEEVGSFVPIAYHQRDEGRPAGGAPPHAPQQGSDDQHAQQQQEDYSISKDVSTIIQDQYPPAPPNTTAALLSPENDYSRNSTHEQIPPGRDRLASPKTPGSPKTSGAIQSAEQREANLAALERGIQTMVQHVNALNTGASPSAPGSLLASPTPEVCANLGKQLQHNMELLMGLRGVSGGQPDPPPAPRAGSHARWASFLFSRVGLRSQTI